MHPGCEMNPLTRKTPGTPISKRAPAAKPATAVEPCVESGKHKRKSARHIVPLDRQSCKLKVGGKVLSASLVNESRGGFAIWTDSVDSLKMGDKVQLHTDQGWFTARIVYLREVAKSQDAQTECDSWFQLGLEKAGGLLCLLDAEPMSSEGTRGRDGGKAFNKNEEEDRSCHCRGNKSLRARAHGEGTQEGFRLPDG